MARLDRIPVIDEGLGNSSHLLEVGDGRALALDPERDVRRVRAEAGRRGLRIAWAIETRLHADVISGMRELAAVEGASELAPDAGPRGFAVQALRAPSPAASCGSPPSTTPVQRRSGRQRRPSRG